MNLRQWISSHPIGQRGELIASIATAFGVTEAAVRHYLSGKRAWPAKVDGMAFIEKLTDGAVTRHDILPDTYGPSSLPQRKVAA
jgi:DNA-binding transcriptional regulator YdaS (Cro superfamily)